jgi:hypothetical protein
LEEAILLEEAFQVAGGFEAVALVLRVVAEASATGRDVLLEDDFRVAGGFRVEDSFEAEASTLCGDVLFGDTFRFDRLWAADGF